MRSIGKQLELIHGMLGTKDLNNWEEKFVEDMHEKYKRDGKSTSNMTSNQIFNIEKIHNKHFS